jgi:hypothetical protein
MNIVLAFGYPLYDKGIDPKLSSSFRARLAEIDFPVPSFINTDFERFPFVGVVIETTEFPESGFIDIEEILPILIPTQDKVSQLNLHMESKQFPEDIAEYLEDHFGETFAFFYFPESD